MNKVFGHLKTITKHKIKVGQLCFRCHLYKQGLLHDLSKYSYTELKTGFKYYQGYRSPIDAEKEEKGYSMGWMHHKGRNKHHWEYWLDNSPNGVIPIEMPKRYALEMFCDGVAASMIYKGDAYTDRSPLDYFEGGRKVRLMHPNTDALLTHLFNHLADNGLDKTIEHILKDIKGGIS